MATLNFIMPDNLKEGFCERREKQNKVKHSWVPTGQTKAMFGDQVAIECYCKHCNKREWTQTSRLEFTLLQDYWKELR
jgi:hypothetical protein|tara:strand:+ start:488 stop:721 length:234 start_codon:yes stop_codon:yes gene_type:complete